MAWYFDPFKVNLIWPSSAFTTPLSSEIHYLLELSTYDCFSDVGTASNKDPLVKKPWEEDWHKPERRGEKGYDEYIIYNWHKKKKSSVIQ